MSRFPRFARIGLVAVAGLFLLLAVTLYLMAGTDHYKARLERTASQTLGMEFHIADRPGIAVFPGLRLTLKDVRIGHKGEEVALAEQATVGIELLSLLGQELRIDRIVLTRPVITIVRERDGRFNFERPEPDTTPLPAQQWPDVSLSAGTVVFVDKRFDKGFEARDCQGNLHRLRHPGGARANLLRDVSLSAELGCAQVSREGFTVSDVKFSAQAKNGILDLKPLTTHLLGTQGTGSVRADFSGAVAAYQITYTLTQFPVEAFFDTMSLKKLASGRMDFSATLATRGTTLDELKRAATGHVSLHGKGLTFIGSDLDRSFERFEASQTFSLVDVGAVFFAGPLGLLVTKGYDFAKLLPGTGGSSRIRTLVSDWKVEHGVAQAQDVAMATDANRIALHGGLDLVNERFDEVTVALVDAKGCVKVQQQIRGTFGAPVVDPPNALQTLVGPALRLLKKGGAAIFGSHCDPFYTGSVAAPG